MSPTPDPGRRGRERPPAVLRLLAALALVVAPAAACGSSSSPSTSPTSTAAATAGEFGPVTVSGKALSRLTDSGNDPAVGMRAPTVTGHGFDGSPISLSTRARPTVVLFLAHWCPHCNREVPLLVSQWKQQGLPEGVRVLSVSTGANENAPNWPPSRWIASERWPVPVLADDKAQHAASAFGLPGYPYFVLLKPDGTVFWRGSGELPLSSFNERVDALVAASG